MVTSSIQEELKYLYFTNVLNERMRKHYKNIIIHHRPTQSCFPTYCKPKGTSPCSFYHPPFLVLKSNHSFFRISWLSFFPSFLPYVALYIYNSWNLSVFSSSALTLFTHSPHPLPCPPLTPTSVKFSPSHSLFTHSPPIAPSSLALLSLAHYSPPV